MRDSCRRGRRADLRLTGHSSLDPAVVRSVLTGVPYMEPRKDGARTSRGRSSNYPQFVVMYVCRADAIEYPAVRGAVWRPLGLWVTIVGSQLGKTGGGGSLVFVWGSTATSPSIANAAPVLGCAVCVRVVRFTAAAAAR